MSGLLIKIGVIGAVLLGLVIWHAADRRAAVAEGRAAERAETLARGVELVQERDRLNTTVRNATAEDICRQLGGRTVDGECL